MRRPPSRAVRHPEASAIVHLLRELIKRDFRARFTGSALGLGWAVLQPLSLVALYWFVFTYMIPGGRAGIGGEGYIAFLVSGLLPWLAINEGLTRSATAIVENSSIVRRLPLRSELLVIVPNASAMIFQLIGMALFLVALLWSGAPLGALWILPLAMLLQLALQTGIGLVLAATYVFFRDLAHVLAFILSFVFYLSPVLYRVAPRFEAYFFWNPLTPLLGLFRSALLGAPLPEAASIVFLLAAVTAAMAIGLFFFRRLRPTLVDLI